MLKRENELRLGKEYLIKEEKELLKYANRIKTKSKSLYVGVLIDLMQKQVAKEFGYNTTLKMTILSSIRC